MAVIIHESLNECLININKPPARAGNKMKNAGSRFGARGCGSEVEAILCPKTVILVNKYGVLKRKSRSGKGGPHQQFFEPSKLPHLPSGTASWSKCAALRA